jgi:hypothetical protein
MEKQQVSGYSGGPGSAHCKTVGLAYVGSNPTPATIKTPGQAWYRAILPRRLRERSEIPLRLSGGPRGSRVWPGRSVSASTRAESCIAAVLLGVVELWLSQGRPKTARTGVWGFGRTDLRAPVGFQNSATGPGLGFYAVRSHSLMRPPRTGRRLIRSWERSATG